MAEGGDCNVNSTQSSQGIVIGDVADWPDDQDSDSHKKRSDIVYAIIHNKDLKDLNRILDSGWDVNEVLDVPNDRAVDSPRMDLSSRVQTTALCEASRQCWTEGVKMLLAAGADCMVPGVLETPLDVALQHCKSPDIIELLLKHGADPNPSEKLYDSLPLVQAIRSYHSLPDIVQLLLENGADPNVTGDVQYKHKHGTRLVKRCPLAESIYVLMPLLQQEQRCAEYPRNESFMKSVNEVIKSNAALFKTLVRYGADVNCNVTGIEPILHRLVVIVSNRRRNGRYTRHSQTRIEWFNAFLEEHLNIFYENGGNINTQFGDHGSALEDTVSEQGHSNCVRWLIRHGADIDASMFSQLKRHFIPISYLSCAQQRFEETLLILLKAGMRVSHSSYILLIKIEKEIQTLFNQHPASEEIPFMFNGLWKEEPEDFQKPGQKAQKSTFPEYLGTQMADLEEFSDESLQVYPQYIPERWQPKGNLTFALDQIHKVLEFLNHTQSLQWFCRRCVRENLVSLAPSAVKSLPIPGKLKRYILCHEI